MSPGRMQPDSSQEPPQSSRPKCALCGKLAVEAYRPFCSKRCADIDLNRWLRGVYAIPVEDDEDEDGETPRAGQSRDSDESLR